MVSEGRDQGSVVFPQAKLKIFLDADPKERARRRVAQLRARGETVDFNEILDQIMSRDYRDKSRPVGPMVVAPDAWRIDSTHLTEDQVVEMIVGKVERLKA